MWFTGPDPGIRNWSASHVMHWAWSGNQKLESISCTGHWAWSRHQKLEFISCDVLGLIWASETGVPLMWCTEHLAVIWRFLHRFRATYNYLKLLTPISSHLQLFEASNAYLELLAPISSFFHLFWASCSYLKLLAPISSLLQLFEASRTYFEPLAIIWSYLHLFHNPLLFPFLRTQI